jgi:uncharacterized repeat protein (TIGR01451 family)
MSPRRSFLILSLITLITGISAPAANRVLVYDGGGVNAPIQQAMQRLGITDFNVRTPENPVTLKDLATHDILVVGRSNGGNMTGLDPCVLAAGITGRILLTGHDADNHTVFGPEAAATFLSQAISFATEPPFTGLVALGDSAGFSYLPENWGVSATGELASDIITSFTEEGLASGVFDGLTPVGMSYWYNSYHAKFVIWGPEFVSFELGGTDGNDIVTIAKTRVCGITLTKVDDVNYGNCVGPGDEIKYTISYGNPITDPCNPNYIGTLNDVNIIDYLPDELEFISASGGGTYNSNSHRVTWNIGTISPGDANSVKLTVKVLNKSVSECGAITNLCEIKSGNLYSNWTYEDTPVCCASNPRPACGGTGDLDVNKPRDINLVWCKGFFAADVNGHDVYFGTSFDDVNNATTTTPSTYKGKQSEPNYLARNLAPYTTYFWRIDEVNLAGPDPCIWRGPVWSFTTGLFIENFSEYVSSDELNTVWKKTHLSGSCPSGGYVGGGATLTLSAETMILNYNNTGALKDRYSEARFVYPRISERRTMMQTPASTGCS